MRIQRFMEFEQEDTKRNVLESREEVNTDPKLDPYCKTFTGKLTEFESMWSGHQGRINVLKLALICHQMKFDQYTRHEIEQGQGHVNLRKQRSI